MPGRESTVKSTPRSHPGEAPSAQAAEVGSFLGRAEERTELAETLRDARLLTLTGPPGIGKTRLALELCGELSERYPDGARLIELAPVGDPALLPGVLASALSVPEAPGQTVTEVLIAHLRRRRLLLVVDNCEHLLGACAELVEALLQSCPELRVLATSREPLAVPGERTWVLPPLSVPDSSEAAPEALIRYDAVRLFVERARATQPDFALNTYVAPDVAEIARRLDGIPLAIELAAARVETLTPAELARRLDDRFALLTRGNGSALPRHTTLQAALDWSHELLSAPEQALLRRLSVFVGGFDVEAVESICAGGAIDAGSVFDRLAGLAAKSLVGIDGSSDKARYRLLETVRAYGADRLEETGETAALREAHARFYLSLAEDAEPQLVGPAQEGWFERLEAERANFRGALEWALSGGRSEWALRLAGALVLFWRVRCHFSEGRGLLDATVSAGDAEAPALRARGLWGAGFLTLMAGDPQGAARLLEESLSIFRELDDRQGCARALLILGNCCQFSGDPNDALSLLEQSVALARETADLWCLAHALGVAGFENTRRGDLPAARPVLEECLAVARESQDQQSLRMALLGRGSLAILQGDYRLAESLLEEAVAVARELGEDYATATALMYLGQLAVRRGQYQRAEELLEEAVALIPEVGPAGAGTGPLLLLGRVAHARGDRRRAQRLFQEILPRSGTGKDSIPVLQAMGELAAEEGQLDRAHRLLEEALERARAAGDQLLTAEALCGLGRLARDAGENQRAAALHEEALALQDHFSDAPGMLASVEAVGGLAAAAGRHEEAGRLLGAAHALRDSCGYARTPWESASYEADLALVRQELSRKEFEGALRQGARLSTEQAVAQAAKGLGRRGRPANGWTALTATEQKVAALLAEGLTNREIAERLFITPSTVKKHVSNIFCKLGVTRRSELAGAVWRRRRQHQRAI